MKKHLSACLGAFLLAAGAQATIRTIQVSDFQFSPAASLSVPLGDTVRWVWVSGTHTATSSTIPAGAATWDSPITSGITSFMYKPTVVGSYNYVCTPHASMGMVGSFTVTAPTAVTNVVAAEVFKLSPNPVSHVLKIELLRGEAVLNMVDATGKSVFNQAFSGKIEIPVGTLANGIYFVRVQQNGQEAASRIVVAH